MARWWVLLVALSATGAEAQPRGPIVPAAKLDPRLRVPGLPGVPVQLYVRLAAADAEQVDALRGRGLAVELVDPERGLVQGWADPADVAGIAALAGVERVRPADRARPRSGPTTTEGDAAARADLVRAQGYDGAGVRVGVISDGIDALAAAQATGELGAVGIPSDARCRAGAGDEGVALLEIVHDLAPGAELFFSGAATSLEFIDAVRCLVDAGVDVLVDDLGFYAEPYFRDGPVAVAVREAVVAGVSYVSAAGNDAGNHLQQLFRITLCGDYQDFGGTTCTSSVVVEPLDTLECVLQWNDPFPGATNDYDLFVVDESLAVLAAGDDVQDGTQEPIEFVSWTNPDSAPRTVGLRIRKTHGEPRLLEMFCFGGVMQYVTPVGSIFGHPAVAEVLTAGAIDVHAGGLATVEPYSSRGPAELFFPVATRAKPDLVGFDDVTTGIAGFAPFFGTSAAAAHVAAVAALVRGKNPFLSPAEVQAFVSGGAVDVSPPGADPASGAGRLDALAAVAAVAAPECRTSADCGASCPIDTCNLGTCVHSAVRGVATGVCTGQPVPRGIARRFARACRLAARVGTAPTPRKAKRLVRRTLAALAAASRIATRAGRDRVSPACAAAIGAALAQAEQLVVPPETAHVLDPSLRP
jgi:subtilisin family serine protease